MHERRGGQCIPRDQHDDHLKRKGEDVEDSRIPRRSNCDGIAMGGELPGQQRAEECEQDGENIGIRHDPLKGVHKHRSDSSQKMLAAIREFLGGE